MSNTRLTVGLAVPMPEGIDPDFVENYKDDQYDALVQVAYDGKTLLYMFQDDVDYEVPFAVFDPINMMDDFRFEAKEAGFGDIDLLSVKVFVDHWYDGADSNHMELTPEKLKEVQ